MEPRRNFYRNLYEDELRRNEEHERKNLFLSLFNSLRVRGALRGEQEAAEREEFLWQQAMTT